MATLEARCLDAFPNWLRSLGEDARALAAVLESRADQKSVEQLCCAALNYLFKSLDLIPDGLEDLGFIDDAFVMRAAARAIKGSDTALSVGASGSLARLADEAELVTEFLGREYDRLSRYVTLLEQGSVRGRSVSAILGDAQLRADFVREVAQWADGYGAPSFARDERNLVKLRSFLLAKLPA